MNFPLWIQVKRLLCFLVALAALVRTSVHGWETILTHEMPGYTVSASSIALDSSTQWAAQRLFVGTLVIPTNEDVDPDPPGKILIIDPNTGMDQEADLPGSRVTEVLGFSRNSGALFAYSAGSSDAPSPNRLLRSSDQGVSWTVVDTLPTDVVEALAGDDEGNLFTAGNRWTVTNGIWRFLGAFIRKSTDDGLTWNTVDAPNGTEYRRLHFLPGPEGGLFAGGSLSPTYGWIVRRSRDHGTTWTTVLSTQTTDYVQAITSDRRGVVYVIGAVYGASLRTSMDGGNTWQSLRGPGSNFSAADMVTDANGSLYVLGEKARSHSVFRRNAEGNWDDLGPNTSEVRLWRMGLDAAGNLYCVGNYGKHPDVGAIVMRLALDPVALPPLEVASSGGAVTVSWPTVEGAHLESTTVLGQERNWVRVLQTAVMEGTRTAVKLTPEETTTFFRLSRP
jgi:hypothetical protein